jgi:two-component system response regulator FixJ
MKNKKKQYEVFFVDDDPAVRSAVAQDLEDLGCKVSCFANASDCLDQLPEKNCNLLITDVKMPGMDGMALLSKLKQVAPWVPVVVVTGYGDIPMCARAFRMGAVDFIEKPLDRDSFLRKVKTILRQNDFIDTPAGNTLTKTEKKVLKLILDGDGNKQIANKLNRALRSAERHRSSIMRKFGVDNIVDLVKKAVKINLDNVE